MNAALLSQLKAAGGERAKRSHVVSATSTDNGQQPRPKAKPAPPPSRGPPPMMMDASSLAAAAMAARARMTGEEPEAPQGQQAKKTTDTGSGKKVQMRKAAPKDAKPAMKKLGGALPVLKKEGSEMRPDLSSISEVAAYAAKKRRERLKKPQACLKVTDSCPYPCCQGVQPVHFAVVGGKVVAKKGEFVYQGPHAQAKLRPGGGRPRRGGGAPNQAQMAMQAQAAMRARQAAAAGNAPAPKPAPAPAPAKLTPEEEERKKLEEEIKQIQIMLAEKLKLEAEIKAIQEQIAAAAAKK